MTAKTGLTTGPQACAVNRTGLLLVRAMTVALCWVVFQVITINHFVFTLLKGRYLSYEISFYVVIFAASLLVCLPWNLARNKWAVVFLLFCSGYLSSAVAFWIEPLIRYGSWPPLFGSRGAIFYRELFISPLFSLGWLFGIAMGIAMVTLERFIVVRARPD